MFTLICICAIVIGKIKFSGTEKQQPTVAAIGFQDALGHGNAGGNPVAFHVGDGYFFVLVYVFFPRLPHLSLRREDGQ